MSDLGTALAIAANAFQGKQDQPTQPKIETRHALSLRWYSRHLIDEYLDCRYIIV